MVVYFESGEEAGDIRKDVECIRVLVSRYIARCQCIRGEEVLAGPEAEVGVQESRRGVEDDVECNHTINSSLGLLAPFSASMCLLCHSF